MKITSTALSTSGGKHPNRLTISLELTLFHLRAGNRFDLHLFNCLAISFWATFSMPRFLR
jgi:hypothetical protein